MNKIHIPLPEEIDYSKKFRLDGKVIIITGGQGLIGSAFVEACAQYGAHVVIADIAQSKPDEFCKKLSERFEREMLGVVTDVSDRQSVEALRDKVLNKFEKIDGLVNCHQKTEDDNTVFRNFEEFDDDEWDSIIKINLRGVYMTCQVIGSWIANSGNGGSIVNIPSTYSVVAPNQNLYEGITNEGCTAVYPSSKGGVMALSQYLATYWAAKGVRVNQITPHGVAPHGDWDDAFEKRFAPLSPMGRLSFNHEVPGALIYLLSEASSYVTGHNLVVDGGWTAW
jgi:NAD(P)-dependent dehydrogenase (short-subunit alcohol dehydrogenase family)